MLLPTFPALFLAMLGQDGPPPLLVRPVLVTEVPLTGEDRAKIFPMDATGVIGLYVGRGFERVDRGGIAYFFSPRLWAKKEIEDRLAIWQEMSKAVKPDGSLELPLRSKLVDLANAGFGGMGYGSAAGSRLLVNSSSSITLVVNGERKTVMLPGSTGDGRASLSDRPLRPLDPRAMPKAVEAAGAAPGRFIAPDALCAYCPSRDAFDPTVRMGYLKVASAILEERYAKAQAEIDALRSDLAKRLSGGDPFSGAVRNARFGELSSELQANLRSHFVEDYRHFGFQDEGEATRWLDGARVGNFGPTGS